MSAESIDEQSSTEDRVSSEKVIRLTGELARLQSRVEELEDSHAVITRESEEERRIKNALEEAQKALKKSLEVNRKQLRDIAKVHSRFLPIRFPKVCGIEVAAYCRPCADVGGDFYDMFQMRDGRLALCMADVAGHGAMAAVGMATTRALLRTALLEAEPYWGPSDILLKLSEWFQYQLETEQFVTMWLGIYDPETCVLRYSSAAHPPAAIWRHGGTVEYLKVDPTIPLGLAGISPQPADEDLVRLQVGDRVFLYTDGWIETASAQGEVLEGERFLDFLANAYGAPVSQVPAILFMEFERHAANTRIRDDVSLFVFDRVE